jgi:ADP-ribose pyrophosphatase YjhB (NUDIX family)
MVGTSGVIFNDRGEILLLKHRFWKKDSWGLPSGYLKSGKNLKMV